MCNCKSHKVIRNHLKEDWVSKHSQEECRSFAACGEFTSNGQEQQDLTAGSQLRFSDCEDKLSYQWHKLEGKYHTGSPCRRNLCQQSGPQCVDPIDLYNVCATLQPSINWMLRICKEKKESGRREFCNTWSCWAAKGRWPWQEPPVNSRAARYHVVSLACPKQCLHVVKVNFSWSKSWRIDRRKSWIWKISLNLAKKTIVGMPMTFPLITFSTSLKLVHPCCSG